MQAAVGSQRASLAANFPSATVHSQNTLIAGSPSNGIEWHFVRGRVEVPRFSLTAVVSFERLINFTL